MAAKIITIQVGVILLTVDDTKKLKRTFETKWEIQIIFTTSENCEESSQQSNRLFIHTPRLCQSHIFVQKLKFDEISQIIYIIWIFALKLVILTYNCPNKTMKWQF